MKFIKHLSVDQLDEVELCCERIREGLNNVEIEGENETVVSFILYRHHISFIFKDESFRIVLAAMEQGKVKRLTIKSFIG